MKFNHVLVCTTLFLAAPSFGRVLRGRNMNASKIQMTERVMQMGQRKKQMTERQKKMDRPGKIGTQEGEQQLDPNLHEKRVKSKPKTSNQVIHEELDSRYHQNETGKQKQKKHGNHIEKENSVKVAGGGTVALGGITSLPKEKKYIDCGSFLIKQTSGLVVYDDFDEVAPEDSSDGVLCQGTQDGKEFCFGKDQQSSTTLRVQGKCNRGRGSTSIAFTNGPDSETKIVFACEGSTMAKPDIVNCKCTFMEDNTQKCNPIRDILFQAEARYGSITMKEHVSAHCTLECKMPTTDE
uniref:Uncharacterized protein n=1 Tax=Amphora coffeiformis TaxID=265554 RepID=A0A7S3P9C8_9STRA|mmetsp:Transcript_5854/g.11457  ORF Transcript_5854/g.11457 Transcript_5854/m.11457 type:complete len:294 (+) Transcript_5854:188-1069(+)